jgi:hypothetical protein
MLKRVGVFGYGPPQGVAFNAPLRAPAFRRTNGLPRTNGPGDVVRTQPPRIHYGRVASLPNRRGR